MKSLVESYIVRVADQSTNEEDWKRFVETYLPKLLTSLQAMGLTREQAEDATSQLFLKLLEGVHYFDPRKGSFFNYLLQCAKNIRISEWRKFSKKIKRGGTTMADLINNLSAEECVEQNALEIKEVLPEELKKCQSHADAEFGNDITSKVVANMELRTWQAFLLRNYRNLTSPKVAEILDMPLTSAARARARVLEKLQEAQNVVD